MNIKVSIAKTSMFIGFACMIINIIFIDKTWVMNMSAVFIFLGVGLLMNERNNE